MYPTLELLNKKSIENREKGERTNIGENMIPETIIF